MTTFTDYVYEIDFSNKVKTETIRYRVIDTAVSNIWLRLVQDVLSAPGWEIYRNQSRHLLTTTEDFYTEWQFLASTVYRLRAAGMQLDTIDVDTEIVFDSTLSHRLNCIHREFHEFHEKNANTGQDNVLEELNASVHRLEHMYNRVSGRSGNSVFATFFLTRPGVPTSAPITDPGLYSEWNYVAQSGDLTLGYHTVGKSLIHCHKDADTALVAAQMVRPQQVIGNEIMMTFMETQRRNPVIEAHKRVIAAKKWVRETGNYDNVDWSHPGNNVGGSPLLAKVIGNYSPSDANAVLSLGPVSSVRLIKC